MPGGSPRRTFRSAVIDDVERRGKEKKESEGEEVRGTSRSRSPADGSRASKKAGGREARGKNRAD